MGIVRVLVDGYSLLHFWPELAQGKPRHSFYARDALVSVLTQYQDASGMPVTVIFDGGGAPPGTPKNEFEPQYEHSITKAVNRLQFSIFQILKIILLLEIKLNLLELPHIIEKDV